jgi:hypothetical protein
MMAQSAPLQQIIRYYENLYGKSYTKFNGREIATAILSFNWAEYAMERYNNWSEPPIPSKSTGNLERTVDGIRIVGSRRFIDRVADALELIKEYDPSSKNLTS